MANNNFLVIVLVIGAAFLLMNGGFGTQSTGGDGVSPSTGGTAVFDGTTVKFSSWDMFSRATDAGSGHLALELGNNVFQSFADDGTVEATAGESYITLLGNTTTSLSASDYYPTVVTGVIPDAATFEIAGGQAKVAGSSQITATFRNEDGTANTDQALGTNDEATVEVRYKVGNNFCAGNPNTGRTVDNALCFQYNTTTIQEVELIGQDRVSVPNSITAAAGKQEQCFTMPVICDNEDFEADLRIESSSTDPDTSGTDDITVYFVDGSVDYDADTLELIYGYEDEDLNDIGIQDFSLDTITVS